jgi:hypothetical protein
LDSKKPDLLEGTVENEYFFGFCQDRPLIIKRVAPESELDFSGPLNY